MSVTPGRIVDTGEVRLHVVEAGDPNGPLVVLLHGFPEFWYSWRNQMPALAAAGYRAVAPDLRGYGGSDKPRSLDAYRLEQLVDDVAGLIHALAADRAHVVGHDWGATIAWSFAMRHPDLLDRLVILNVPHPARLRDALRMPRQWLRSSYVLFFQLPWLPEAVLHAGRFAFLRRELRAGPTRPDAFTPEDIERYVNSWSEPGGLTGGLNYYRAIVRRRPDTTLLRRIDAPVLVIWGERDRFILPELAEPPAELVPNLRVVRLPRASHWVQHDDPERVNRLLLEFLGGSPTDR